MSFLRVENLRVFYRHQDNVVRAVDDVSFSISKGKTLGLIGESGCGKTTLAKAICRLIPVESGSVRFCGIDITNLNGRKLRETRKWIQLIFQDSDSALNPKKQVGSVLREILKIHGIVPKVCIEQEVERLMHAVGLPAEMKVRYPHELSGGQRQRIGIARALAVQPKVLICDEPVSALDACIQSQIIQLVKNLQKDKGFSVLLIAHGLMAVKSMADEIAVMYLGKIVEYGSVKDVFEHPLHPYTKALLDANPVASPTERYKRKILVGEAVYRNQSGCAFANRCLYAKPLCSQKQPEKVELKGHCVACFFPLEGGAAGV